MKISLNWVKQFTDVDVSTDELIKLATERLGGIEGVTELSKHYDGIVVAKVVSCVKHPNADKLSLCKIDDGKAVKDVARDENGYVQVVCGAPNVRAGLFVAWIPPGATLPASYGDKELFVLEARDLRGETSNGMLASPAELGISDDHGGILEIGAEAVIPAQAGIQKNELDSRLRGNDKPVKPGTPFKELYGLDDTILEIENKMFTHRPDGFGQLGVAREIAGIQHKAFKSPEWYLDPVIPTEVEGSGQISRQAQNDKTNITVSIEDTKLCPRYMAVVLENVEIKPSPIWLQSYLKRVGVRPINNVVDITNYMMLLTAQPLHAFDFDKVATSGRHPELDSGSNNELDSRLRGNDEKRVNIIVRRPKPGEKMKLLDGKEIEPHKDATLICNPDGPIALGGVMGGGNSEVDETTTRVVLECATFDMYNIRKTSMVHGIFTDAVTRFTKGQPAGQLPPVLAKTIAMFEELAGAKVAGNVIDANPKHEAPSSAKATDGRRSTKHEYIEIEAKFINDRLGSKFSDDEIVKLLTNVEFAAHVASGPISVTPPFWRTDIEIPEDIVEEIGRLYGFNQLPIELPKRSIAPVTPEPQHDLKRQIRQILSRAGANELLTYSFVHGDLLQKAGQDPARAFAIRNALSPDLQYYRLSLLPSLLDKVRANTRAGYDEFTLFEIGKAHNKAVVDDETGLPDEINNLEVVYTSVKPKKGAPYYQMLRTVDYLLADLGITYTLEPLDSEAQEQGQKMQALTPFDLARSAYIYNATDRGGMIGLVGELKASVIKAFKLPEHTAAALFALDGPSFEEQNRHLDGYQPLSKFPSTEQDLTLKVAAEVSFAEVETLLKTELSASEYDWQLLPLGIFQLSSRHPELDSGSTSHGKQIPDTVRNDTTGTKNISFRIILTHHERTLTTSEVTKLVEALSWRAHESLGAEQV